MTLKDKKEYLESYLQYHTTIKQKQDEINKETERLETLATNATGGYSFMPKSKGKGKEDSYIKLVQYKDKIKGKLDKEIDILSRKKQRVVEAIEQAGDDTLINILKYHHINGLTFAGIAEKMDYSERNIYFLYRKALNRIL